MHRLPQVHDYLTPKSQAQSEYWQVSRGNSNQWHLNAKSLLFSNHTSPASELLFIFCPSYSLTSDPIATSQTLHPRRLHRRRTNVTIHLFPKTLRQALFFFFRPTHFLPSLNPSSNHTFYNTNKPQVSGKTPTGSTPPASGEGRRLEQFSLANSRVSRPKAQN